MDVYIEKTNQKLKHTAKNVKELLNDLDINPDTVLVSKNNEIVLPDEDLSETDDIKIISVVSGG